MNDNTIKENNSCCKNNAISLALYSSIIAILLSKDLNSNEQNILANFLQNIGQNLALISAYESDCEEKNQENS